MTDLQILLLTVFGGLFVMLISYVFSFLRSFVPQQGQENEQQVEQPQQVQKKPAQKQQPAKADGPGKKAKKLQQQTSHQQSNFAHPWLMTSLKGHSGPVKDMDFSNNGKFLASCSADRSVLIWPTKLFTAKSHNPIRGNVAYDVADRIKWSPDSKAFILHKANANELEVYKLQRKTEGDGYTVASGNLSFGVQHSECSEVVAMDMASSGRYIMTASSTTDLVLYDLKGEVIQKLDSCLMQTYCAGISPNAKFVAASGFTPDVKVWEVKATKSGEIDKIKRAFELTGHRSGIWGFAFNADSSRMATLSKDKTWRLYNIEVEFDRGQDPILISSGPHPFDPEATEFTHVRVALSPDAKTLAASCDRDIFLFDTVAPSDVQVVSDVHVETISGLLFDDEGKKLVSCGDKHIRIFHNVPGLRRNMLDFQSELKSAKSEGLKTRLKEQIAALKESLDEIET